MACSPVDSRSSVHSVLAARDVAAMMPEKKADFQGSSLARAFGAEPALSIAKSNAVWGSLSIFCRYRLVITIILALSYWGFQRYQLLTPTSVELAVTTLGTYFLAAIALTAMAQVRSPGPTLHLSMQVVVDVVAMTLLMHASGGVKSGIGILLLVTLAASGLVARGRIAFFYAAIAALAILLQQSWHFLAEEAQAGDFVQAGLLAGAYFVVAGLGYTLAKYAEGAEKIAAERSVDLANLAQINELVIRDMQDGFIVVDERGVVRQQNPQSASLVGGLTGARGKALSEVAPQIAVSLAEWRRTQSPTPRVMRDAATQKEYQVRFVSITNPATPDHTAPTVVFVEDASRLRAQAQQLKLAALGRLTASIAHEIRNPLSSISHAAELLQEDAELASRTSSGSENRVSDLRLLAIIRDNAFRLDRMVQEVLYLNRRDRAHPEAIDLGEYLPRFAQQFCDNEKMDVAKIALQITSDAKPRFDRSHLDQILWNLVRNANHYARGAIGAICITVRAADGAKPGHGSWVIVEVDDDGPGVPEEALAHLFEPFFTTATSGTGLGLYIARELADVNDAALEYVGQSSRERSDTPRAGACFRLTMKRE